MTTGGNTIYDDLGVPPVINATGTKTRIGGTLIREEALEAMNRAAEAFVRISDLQAAASERISEVTGADAGYVTNGASSALTLGAAACIAGDDLELMANLPDTEGVPSEIVMPRTHRNGYDHALRAAGADIVDVGANDYHLGTGSENTQPWQLDAAITEETVAVAYMEKPFTRPPLETVVEIAHDNDVPVIVDAAAELPPTGNLSKYVDQGVDLVAFSGGKAIRGPQSSGILAGREDLIKSVARQHLDMHASEPVYDPPEELVDLEALPGVPLQGLGRSMKVGKEEIAGLIAALDAFVAEDDEAVLAEWHDRSERIAGELESIDVLDVEVANAGKTDAVSTVVVTVDEERSPVDAEMLVSALRAENPRIFVGGDDVPHSQFTINPRCLADSEADYVVDRIAANLEIEAE
ncbi:aminotransferase class V-fold PLP-dependent enzyme [Natronoglomus mannanivorans]|uniref:Aminotransferase class V-fold PLP-dependent enzyme n=1 Tax=Natronoglomus mannanivorans TaxID=2979990 RepID=A0AAP2Z122_9EURY|nr:aminotransferase class V-fold PLP-dependent enzyme [Halobacteria archaeon AArc-xg1-1]